MRRRRFIAIAVLVSLVAVLVAVAPAGARLNSVQKLFRKSLLAEPSVSESVKTLLRENGGFIERSVEFIDLTNEGKADAIVLVNSGTASGNVAVYVFSSGRGRTLRLVFKSEDGFQLSADTRVRAGKNILLIDRPSYKAGDSPCCPSSITHERWRWKSEDNSFERLGAPSRNR